MLVVAAGPGTVLVVEPLLVLVVEPLPGLLLVVGPLVGLELLLVVEHVELEIVPRLVESELS